MRKFNGYAMRGLTEEDNKIILEHNEKEIELTVDNQGRVWNEGGQYIADAEDTEIGDGLYC